MSGFEHYDREIADLDNEIRHYAAVCGVDLSNRSEIDACLRLHHDGWIADKARESLQGLLILRLKLETEMLELGFTGPPMVPQPPKDDGAA